MIHIQNIIANECIVNIPDRDDNVASVIYLIPVKIKRILDLCQKNAGQFLFQNMVCRLLEVGIDGQVYVISSLGVFSLNHFDHLAHTVDVQLDLPFLSLEGTVKRLFQP